MEINTQYLREVLAILKEAGATHFRCSEFSVAFANEAVEEEEDSEPVSTDVKGFTAPSGDDEEDEEDLDSPISMHRRAYMGSMPTLFPKKSE